MQREQIAEMVEKYMVEVVDDLDPATMDFSMSMKELGVNSLDIVEIVSCVMRDLRVKVPRVELQNLTNVNQFVDLLQRVVREKEN